jgi:multiple sugar transport system permease protein
MNHPQMKRPVGISLFSGILMASAVTLLAQTVSLQRAGIAGLGRLLAVLILAAAAIGLWKLKNGARILVFFLISIDVVGSLAALFLYALRQHRGRTAVELIIGICIAALLLRYLQRPEVKHAFDGLSAWPATVQALVLTIFTTALAFPFLWMGIATFKQNIDLYGMENNPFLFNLPPTLDHLRFLLAESDFRLAVLLVDVSVAAFMIWAVWKLLPKQGSGRPLLLALFILAAANSLLAFRHPVYRPTAFLLLHVCILISLTLCLWKPEGPPRALLLFLLAIDAVVSTAAIFVYALSQPGGFIRWFGNTTLVGILVVGITLFLALPAAYALARLTGRWGERLGIGIFLTYLIPPTLLFIPLARVVAILGLQDTLWSLVLVYPSVTVPFSVWLLMGFFKSIPKELEDAAMVDGLTRFGAFVKMVVPISLSGILTVVIFTFTLVTQEFVYALTFISPESQQMVGVGVPIVLVRGDVYYWGALMAACLIASVPIAFLYNLFLDRFIAGFTVGAVKG